MLNQGAKLSDIKTNIRTYWAVIKTFLNKIRIPSIPPLFYNNAFVTDFQEKANLFNAHFANQCTVLDTGTVLPTFALLTEAKITDVVFEDSDILDIISSLDSTKAHGWDGMSIRVIKICGTRSLSPLV